MEKLKLEHLAPYLPYGLRTIFDLSDVVNSKSEIRKKLLTEKNVDFVLLYCKPILRPLSDLKKKIQIAEFYMTYMEHIQRIYPSESMGLNPATWSYRVIQWMLERHFDIYSLIPLDLAIDINALEP